MRVISFVGCALAVLMVRAEQVKIVVAGLDQPRVGTELSAAVEEADDAGANTIRYAWWRGDYQGQYEATPVSEDGVYTLTAQDLEHWIKVTASVDDVLVAEKKFWFSKLPVVYFETNDGRDITSKTEYKEGHMRIQGNDVFPLQYDGEMEIKGRGNSSWGFAQKPYKLKLGTKTNLFGFGKNKHWVLISNYQDRTLMRNKFGSDLAKALGIDGMDMTWVVGVKMACIMESICWRSTLE